MRKNFYSSSLNLLQKDSNQGQAIVEYVLMIVVALALVAAMATGFRRSIISLWGFYIRQITAACPGCPARPEYRFR